MIAQEIIVAIRNEIEKKYNESHEKKILAHRDKDYYNETAYGAVMDACNRFLSFLSDLEKSLPAKITDGEVLEWEINRTYHEGSVADTWDIDHVTYENIAEYFYDLGCRRTAEKYYEIEYNRQRAEESEKPMQEELDEEIERYLRVDCSSDDEPSISEVARHFAKWGAEHLKK